jgi:hypothetical protein
MTRFKILPALVAAVGLVACGSTVNRPLERTVGASAGGGGGADAGLSGPGPSLSTATSVAGSASSGAGPSPSAGSVGASGADAGAIGSTLGSGAGASVPGSAPSHSPIQIGIVRTNVSNAAAFGASLGNTVSETDVDNAVVAGLNAGGGVDGHPIVPVYADTDTGSTSWDANFAAACASFTQDHHVQAVLGYVFNFDPSFESCLAKRNIAHLSTSFNIPDVSTLRHLPLLVALSTPRIERRSREKIDGGLATGVITKASRLGFLLDSCPGTEEAWNQVTKPYILSKGLTIASVQQLGCARGEGDAASEAGQAGNAVLQYRTARVDRLMFDAVSEGPALFVLANAAESQGWHPMYIVSSLANAAVIGT